MFRLLLLIWLLCGPSTSIQLNGAVSSDQASPSAATHTEDTCGIPNYASIKGQLLHHYDIFDSFYRLPRFARGSRLQRLNISTETAFLDDDSVCQMLRIQPINVDNGRDSCPGAWELGRDPNRVPCLLRQFRCHCRDCLLPPGQYGRLQCQPIYNYVPVMRKLRDHVTNTDQWTYALDPVVVACTCARRNQVVSARH